MPYHTDHGLAVERDPQIFVRHAFDSPIIYRNSGGSPGSEALHDKNETGVTND
jgi:hypothetical protein